MMKSQSFEIVLNKFKPINTQIHKQIYEAIHN